MDIHKPKPWRGAREFLKEYATIVIGVLTALAAEAVVENLHERRLSAEARQAVRAEINLDLANLKLRAPHQPCVDRRIAELTDFISKAEAGKPFAPPLTIGVPGGRIVYTERWDAATAGGRASLLSSDEQRDFVRVYANLKNIDKYEGMELNAWAELQGLEGVEHPSAELLARARGALGVARVANARVQFSLAQAEDRAADIGIKGEDPQLKPGRSMDAAGFCLPMSTAPADRDRSAGGPKG